MGTVRRMFIHGLESSGQGFKGQLLRSVYDDLLAPDFPGSFEQRMARLHPMLSGQGPWTLVGSSFGGLMAATWTCEHPDQVQRLILLAPALHYPAFAQAGFASVDVPTVVVHGTNDTVVPLDVVRSIAERSFSDLTFRQVDDDHQLHKTVKAMDWRALLDG
jgi:pimeloyl-ACP methyl ester carboxylesterase